MTTPNNNNNLAGLNKEKKEYGNLFGAEEMLNRATGLMDTYNTHSCLSTSTKDSGKAALHSEKAAEANEELEKIESVSASIQQSPKN